MDTVKNYDVVVIGAGSAGLTAAVGFGKAGKKVLLVERGEMGGDCTNVGCIPSKSLIHFARTYYEAKKIAGENDKTEGYRKQALNYVRDKIKAVRDEETPEAFAPHGITVIAGEAEFVAPCEIKVGDTTYKFKKAVIATGASPRQIEIEGADPANILTNENIFDLKEIPERLLIIGSGPIGMELGEAFAHLGSKVSMITRDARLAAHEDTAITPYISDAFNELGIKVYTESELVRTESRQATIKRNKHDETTTVPYDKILVAIGRVPNLPEGLDKAKIASNPKGIEIDSKYRTTNRYVYAVGDVSLRDKFTHTAGNSAREVVGHVLSRGLLKPNRHKSVPKVTYTTPEIAQVGLSYEGAKQKYGAEEIIKINVPYTELDRALTEDNTNGEAVVIAKRLTGKVVGANIVGKNAGEILSVFTLAIDENISLWRLRRLIYAYPTYMLLVQKVGDHFFATQLSNLKKDLGYFLKKHVPKLIAFIFWMGIVISFQQFKANNGLSYKDMLFALYEFFTMSMWGPLIYMCLYAIRPLILFPATLLTALSGVLFGFWWGVAYTILGENASANFAYWIGRFFGSNLRLEDSFLGKYVIWLRERPFESVLFMRLFYVPFDLTNYGSGVLKVSWLSYALATIIGIMPGLTVFVALGAAISIDEYMKNGLTFDAFEPKFLALSVTVFVLSIVLSKLLKRYKSSATE